MNKRTRHIWLIVAALILVFALLLLLLLCRGCGFFGTSTGAQQTNGKTTVGNVTENQIDQTAGDGTEPPFSISFDGVQIDTESTQSATTGATEGASDAGQTTTPPATVPNATESTTLPTEQAAPPANDSQLDKLDYEQYMAWSSQEQQKFFDENFKDDPIAFAQWFQKIKKEYEEKNPPIIVTGPINIEDYLD